MRGSSFFRRKSLEDLQQSSESTGLKRVLSVKDLTFFGIAAIVGAGIFSTIGRASYEGGPAISLLFILVAIACVFTALCYAQFASMIPVSGSAYTYAYFSLGEIIAWILGWALILEYAVSNIVIAISWSGYFTTMLEGFSIFWPKWLATDYWSAYKAYELAQSGAADLSTKDIALAQIYELAPSIGGIKPIFNLPAGLVALFVTILAYVGIQESAKLSNALVWIKLGLIIGVILIGAFYVKPENWVPFIPNGYSGIMGGVAAVFFSFIGFDSVSTTAEECKNPQRDLPRAMLYCIIICTVLYALISLVLTGMMNYKLLNVDDPLAYVFGEVGLNYFAGFISVGAVVTMIGAILVYQIGQPRIWMTMSRDGLLWKKFSKIHPKYNTPSFATMIAGFAVVIPAMFVDMKIVLDLTSVGTFFAFILVCSGVLFLDYRGYSKHAKFKIPYINGQYIILLFFIVALVLFITKGDAINVLQEKPLMYIFWLAWLGLGISSLKLRFSLLPVLGILFNLYLMTELHVSHWLMFLGWVSTGLIIYFGYGRKHSRLRKVFSNPSNN